MHTPNLHVITLVVILSIHTVDSNPQFGQVLPNVGHTVFHPLNGPYRPPVEYEGLFGYFPYVNQLPQHEEPQRGPSSRGHYADTASSIYSFDPRCQYVGQYLPIEGDRCSYLVCDYGTGFWASKGDGSRHLYTIKMACAPGTFVNSQYRGLYLGISPCSRQELSQCPASDGTSKLNAGESTLTEKHIIKNNFIVQNNILKEMVKLSSATERVSRQIQAKRTPQNVFSIPHSEITHENAGKKKHIKSSFDGTHRKPLFSNTIKQPVDSVTEKDQLSKPAPKESKLSFTTLQQIQLTGINKKAADTKRVISVLGMVLNDELESIKETYQAYKMGYGTKIEDIEKDWTMLRQRIKTARSKPRYKELQGDQKKTQELKAIAARMLELIDDLMGMRETVMKNRLALVVTSNSKDLT